MPSRLKIDEKLKIIVIIDTYFTWRIFKEEIFIPFIYVVKGNGEMGRIFQIPFYLHFYSRVCKSHISTVL